MSKRYVPTSVYFPEDPVISQIYALRYRPCRLVLRRTIGYPSFLYKYRAFSASDEQSVRRLRDLLIDSDLWLSSPNDFNDPFDMSAAVVMEGTKTECEAGWKRMFAQINDSPKHKRERIAQLLGDDVTALKCIKDSFQMNLQKVGVSCFTADCKSIHMWSHYGDSHKGIAIQFEPARFAKVFTQPVRVEYKNEYPRVDWLKSPELKSVLIRKHEEWRYEKEWRLILPEMAGHYFNFNAAAITGVVLGCKIDPANAAAIQQLLAERRTRKLPEIKLYRATQHESKYKLLIRRT